MLKGKLNGTSPLRGSIGREIISSGGGSGTSDYPELNDLPQINGVELVGNKTSEDLGLVGKETDPTVPSHVKKITEQDIVSWNNKSEFSGSYKDLKDIPEQQEKPTKLSEFENDTGFVTESAVQDAVKDKATTSYVDKKVADLVGTAPEARDTIEELAQAFEENEDVVKALNSAIGNKADKSFVESEISDIKTQIPTFTATQFEDGSYSLTIGG